MSTPFKEAIDFHRAKVNLPTKKWTDLKGEMHARAFVVAGAMKDSLLVDFRNAIDKAISEGTTLDEFRKDFDHIVEKHGWSYNGKRGWRSKVIYQTNLSTAYQNGRYKQMFDPDVIKHRPYLTYHHGGSRDPRPDHLSWDGLTLPYDDPWWKTHRPKNGWGCKCYVTSHSKEELERQGKEISTPPPIEIDPKTGIAKGIDKGWDYDPAASAWGKPLSEKAMQSWRESGHDAWERLTVGDWEQYGQPKALQPVKAQGALGQYIASKAKMKDSLKGILKGDEKAFKLPQGGHVMVNAETLVDHIPENRSRYLPLIPELLEDPQEIWLTFQKHKGTGKVELRKRIMKVVDLGKGTRIMMVAQSKNGMFEAWTLVNVRSTSYLNNQRKGVLIYAKE